VHDPTLASHGGPILHISGHFLKRFSAPLEKNTQAGFVRDHEHPARKTTGREKVKAALEGCCNSSTVRDTFDTHFRPFSRDSSGVLIARCYRT
jgi:hypothetical protein